MPRLALIPCLLATVACGAAHAGNLVVEVKAGQASGTLRDVLGANK